MNEFSAIKRKRFEEIMAQSYNQTQEDALNFLNLTPASLYVIQNYEEFTGIYDIERIYDEDITKKGSCNLLIKN